MFYCRITLLLVTYTYAFFTDTISHLHWHATKTIIYNLKIIIYKVLYMSSPLRKCIAPSTCALSLFADRLDAVKKGAVPHKNHHLENSG